MYTEVRQTPAKVVDWEFDSLVAAVREVHTDIVEISTSDVEGVVGGS